MTYKAEYERKTVTSDEAVKVVKSGDLVHYGEFVMNSHILDAALARRKEELHNVEVRAVCCPYVPQVVQQDPERKHFIYNDWHFSTASRRSHDNNLCNYISLTYHEGPTFFERGYVVPDVAMIKVGPMDKAGFFNLSTSNSITLAMCEAAKVVIAEVNNSLPKCLGGASESIHISQIDYIVHGDDRPLIELPDIPVSDVDKKIAELVMNEIPDRACLQLGIGAMPNIVGSMIAKSDLKDLGIHTEMLVDSLLTCIITGKSAVNSNRLIRIK